MGYEGIGNPHLISEMDKESIHDIDSPETQSTNDDTLEVVIPDTFAILSLEQSIQASGHGY